MSSDSVLQPAEPSRLFERDVQDALSALQTSLAAVIEALPVYPRRAPELMRALSLERNLAWKMFRLINDRDPFTAARFVPGGASIDAFAAGATQAGVAPALVERVRSAAAHYAEVLRFHAGDRASADIMLGGKWGDAGELTLRRSAFRAASYVAGVQAQTHLQTFFLGPSAAGPDLIDGVGLRGYVDLQRMRPEAPIVIGRSMATDNAGKQLTPTLTEPVDGPLPAGEHVPLLREFCSEPLPRFRRVPGERGFLEDELEEGPVGRPGAITLISADIIRAFATRYEDEQNHTMDMVTRLRTPVKVLVCDVVMHEDLFGPVQARAAIYNDLLGDAMRRGPGRDRYRLPLTERVDYLGKAPQAGHTPDVPRNARVIQHVLERLGWEAGRFDLYRLRLELPFIPTSVVVTFDLLRRG